MRFCSRYPCVMPARDRITGQVRTKRRSAPIPSSSKPWPPSSPKCGPCFRASLFKLEKRSCSCCVTARSSRKITAFGSSSPRPLISPTRASARTFRHFVSSICWAARSLTGGLSFADGSTFVSEALHACELLLKHDVRFGRIPQSRQIPPGQAASQVIFRDARGE